MIGAAPVLVVATLAAVSVSPEAALCELPSDCDAGVCVAGWCREGADRAHVENLHTIAVPPPLVVAGRARLAEEGRRLGEQIAQDLVWTGFYTVLPAQGLPDGWQREGVSPSAVRRVAWQRAGATRVVLCRVDNREAVDFGHAVGVELYQGRFIENLIAEENRRREMGISRAGMVNAEIVE